MALERLSTDTCSNAPRWRYFIKKWTRSPAVLLSCHSLFVLCIHYHLLYQTVKQWLPSCRYHRRVEQINWSIRNSRRTTIAKDGALTWDAVSLSPIYEYRLWLRPRGQPEISWVNLIISSNSSTAGTSSPSLHSHGNELSDLATGIVYQVSVQSSNRFGWSAESNTVNLSGGEDQEVTDYDDTDITSSSSASNIPVE